MMADYNKKLALLFFITWTFLVLLFVFVLGLFDVPFYVEYDEPIEVRVSYGRDFEYEEEEGRVTAVGWGIILLSLTIALRILVELEGLFKTRTSSYKEKQKFFALNNCFIIGTTIFIVAQSMLFKTFLFRVYEQENLGHFTFLNFISTVTHIVLVLLIYNGCKKLYKKNLDKNEKL